MISNVYECFDPRVLSPEDTPTHYRIFRVEGEQYPWHLDGARTIGPVEFYTESVWTFTTFEEAVEALPKFAEIHPTAKKLARR